MRSGKLVLQSAMNPYLHDGLSWCREVGCCASFRDYSYTHSAALCGSRMAMRYWDLCIPSFIVFFFVLLYSLVFVALFSSKCLHLLRVLFIVLPFSLVSRYFLYNQTVIPFIVLQSLRWKSGVFLLSYVLLNRDQKKKSNIPSNAMNRCDIQRFLH